VLVAAKRDGLSIHELARRHGVHRRTVRQALDSPFPLARKTPVRRAPKLDPAKPLIDVMLRADLDAPRKQRHTARRVLARLVDEHGLVELTYPFGAGLCRAAAGGDPRGGRPCGGAGVRAAGAPAWRGGGG